jgi:hypothetical protein
LEVGGEQPAVRYEHGVERAPARSIASPLPDEALGTQHSLISRGTTTST